MRSRPRSPWGALALLVCAPALASASPVEDPPRPPATAGALTPAQTRLVEILRRARSEEDPAYDELGHAAAEIGAPVIRPCLELLEHERVPALDEEQREQILSQPQRGILLAALEQLDHGAVQQALRERLALGRDVPGRRLALRVLGAVGDTDDLAELAGLTLDGHEEEPPRGLEDDMREAVARILVREPRAFDDLTLRLRKSPDALQGVWIAAAGDTHDARALELCSFAFRFRHELAPLAAAQVLRLGRSPKPDVNRELIERLRALLDPEQPGLCRSVLLALGELGDYDSIPTLIGMLESPDAGLVQNGGWALRRITGLDFPDSADHWRLWYEAELDWFRRDEPRVLRELDSRDPAKVSEALREISRRRTQRESLALEVLPVLERPEPSLRVQACDTLGLLGSEVALPALIDRMERDIPYCSQAAWRALGTISGLHLPAVSQAWREALGTGA